MDEALSRAYDVAEHALAPFVDDPRAAAEAVIDALVMDRLATRQLTVEAMERGVWDPP